MRTSFLLSLLLLLSLAALSTAQNSVVTTELWCVAKNNAEDSALQSALDWACGAGGANCSPIQPGAPCYDASDIQNTASYAFNDYFLKNGMTDDSCNFDNTAALTSLNPSTCAPFTCITSSSCFFVGFLCFVWRIRSVVNGFGSNSEELLSFVCDIRFW